MKIEYYLSDVSRQRYNIELEKLVRRRDIKKVLEVGGGATPLLSLDNMEEYGIEYTILDISIEELAKAPDAYNKIQGDITDPNLRLDGKYDLVCSRFLAEHVPSGLI